jgi:hypothetical protein
MDESAYRSDHPDVLAAWEKLHDDTRAWSRAVSELSEQCGFGTRYIMSGPHLVGFPVPDDGAAPEGWRIRDGRGMAYLVPDRRRKIGKQIAARMAEVGACPTTADLPGMPDGVSVPKDDQSGPWTHTTHHPQGHVLLDGYLWCRWALGADLVERPKPEKGDGVLTLFQRTFFDPALWERVRMSEYHAAHEAAEAAEAAPVG